MTVKPVYLLKTEYQPQTRRFSFPNLKDRSAAFYDAAARALLGADGNKRGILPDHLMKKKK